MTSISPLDKPFDAVLFDLDGTLVDTEPHNIEALSRTMMGEFGVVLSPELRNFVIGHAWIEVYERLKMEFGPYINLTCPEIVARTVEARAGVFAEKGVTTMPGALRAVERMSEKFKKAIVTGSARDEVHQVLKELKLEQAFDMNCLVTADDVQCGKPNPEGYQLAMKKLGVLPQRCVVFEDSFVGIAAGKAAGCCVIAIRAGNHTNQDQSAADAIVDSFDDVTDELLSIIALKRDSF